LDFGLKTLGLIYGKVADLRNTLYDKGVFETYGLGARTISVGNLTAGGTGKTPLVAYIACILAERGEKVCILTRGYGRENPENRVLVSDGKQVLAEPKVAGDEPFELASKLVGKAVVIADADRVSAAEWAKRKFGITAFILDDGFQHRRAKRDIDIVCIDATDPFGSGKMLPAGRLREPDHNLKRADIVVITRANLVDQIENLKSEISNLNKPAAVFDAKNKIVRVVALEEFHAKPQRTQRKMRAEKAFAFCGIGNAANFFDQLRQEKYAVISTHSFRDHHIFNQSDVAEIENLAVKSGGKILLTTAKDAVKLSNFKFELPCFVVEIELRLDDPDSFAAML